MTSETASEPSAKKPRMPFAERVRLHPRAGAWRDNLAKAKIEEAKP